MKKRYVKLLALMMAVSMAVPAGMSMNMNMMTVQAEESGDKTIVVKGYEDIETEDGMNATLIQNAKANSEQKPQAWDDGPAFEAFDDETGTNTDKHTWWHSRYQGTAGAGEREKPAGAEKHGSASEANPVWLQTGFGKVIKIGKITWVGRGQGSNNITKYEIQVANVTDRDVTDEDFKKVAEGTSGQNEQEVIFTPVDATHIRLVAKGSNKDDGTVAVKRVHIYRAIIEEMSEDKIRLGEKLAEVVNHIPESADALQEALTAAQAVYDREDATDEECRTELARLNSVGYKHYYISDEILKENVATNSQDAKIENGELVYAASSADGLAVWAFDDIARWWHSRYTTVDANKLPAGDDGSSGIVGDGKEVWIQTGFNGTKYVSRFSMVARAANQNVVKDYRLEVANCEEGTPDEDDWKIVKTGKFENVATEQVVELDKAEKATHVRLVALSVYSGGSHHVAIRRLKFWEKTSRQALGQRIEMLDGIANKTEADREALASANAVYANPQAEEAAIEAENVKLDALLSLVREISVEREKVSVAVGNTVTLNATVKPSGANTNVIWESSDTTVATVDTHGVVTAVAPGQATITVKSATNKDITDTCTVKVVAKGAYTLMNEEKTFTGAAEGVALGEEAVEFVQTAKQATFVMKFKTEETDRQELLTVSDGNGKEVSIYLERNSTNVNTFGVESNLTNNASLAAWGSGNTKYAVDFMDGNWHTLTVVMNGSKYFVYTDGSDKAYDGTTKLSFSASSVLASDSFIPSSVTVGEGFTGDIKFAKVYNYAVTDAEALKDHGYVVTATSRTASSDTSIAAIEIVGKNADGKVDYGKEVTLKAPVADGYKFVGWYNGTTFTGDPISTELEYKTTVTAAANYVALYEANGSVSLTVEGENVEVNGEAYEDVVSKAAGSKVTVSYEGTESFLYWANESGKIVSTEATYTFSLVNNTVLTPVTKSATTGSAFVEFVNEYDQVLVGETWGVSGEDKLPATKPSKLGYNFTGWALETAKEKTVVADDIRTAIKGGATHVRLVPVYTEAAKECDVTYNNGSDEDTVKAVIGKPYTVTAGTVEGKTFSCWKVGETVVSYNEKYTFLVTGDVTVKAVFETEATEKSSILEITKQYEVKDGEKVEKVAFVASREIKEGYKLLEHGMLYAKDSTVADDAFVNGAEGVGKFTASGKGTNGVLTLNVGIGTAKSIKVRAYAVVENSATGAVEVVYSAVSTYAVK